MILANDASKMFQKLDNTETAKCIKEEFLRSQMYIEVDAKELARYLVMMLPKRTIKQSKLEEIFPNRTSNKGKTPGINCPQASGITTHDSDNRCNWSDTRVPTDTELRLMLVLSLEQGVKTSFDNYIYEFGGIKFKQKEGVPTDSQLTMCYSRVVMVKWTGLVRQKLIDAKIKCLMSKIYVVDARHYLRILQLNCTFDCQFKEDTHQL